MKPRVQWADGTPDEVKRGVLEQLHSLIGGSDHMLGRAEVVVHVDDDGKRWRYTSCYFDHTCGTRWLVWVPDELVKRAGPCPLCEPEQTKPADLSPEQRVALVRQLAATDAIDHFHVEADKAESKGRTNSTRWHNPDDLALIDELRKNRVRGYGELRDVSVEFEGPAMMSRHDDWVTSRKEVTVTVVMRQGNVEHTVAVRGHRVDESKRLVDR